MSLYNGKKEKKVLKLTPTKNFAELILIGDAHVGAKFFDEVRLRKTVEYVRQAPNRFAFLMGDLLENVTPNKGGTMLLEQKSTPNQQLTLITEILHPIKNKIIGCIRGNHERRTIEQAMFDIDKIVSDILQIPYFKVGGNFLIKLKKESYRAAFQHGRSGAANPLTELKRMRDVYSNAEICALGHNHQLIHSRLICFITDKEGREKARIVHLVRTGTYLGYADYSRESLYTPPLIGSPIIRFYDNEHKIEIDIDTLAWEVD